MLTFDYKFIFEDQSEKKIKVQLDEETLNLVEDELKDYPEWTNLACSKQPRCKHKEETIHECPVGKSLVGLIDNFGDKQSYEKVKVTIETEERTFVQDTTLQRGLSSLIGIYMVASGCPLLGKLKPMVRHHLPFATIEETIYRVISMYLLAQFFREKQGKNPDWELAHLVSMYDDIQGVNKNLCDKLLSATTKDASLNAVIILNNFANMVPFSIDDDAFEEIEQLFKSYLN
ncbi:MAG: DUF6901 family protein [Chitinophagales bacterium]